MKKTKRLVPKRRFKEFQNDDAWEQNEYNEIFLNFSNNTLSRANLNYSSGKVKNVHYGDILINFGELLDIKKDKIPYVTDEKLSSKLTKSKLENGDIVIADTAEDETVGKCIELVNINEETIIPGLHTIPSRPVLSFSSGYLGYFMNSSAYHDQLLRLMQGTKIPSISRSALQDTIIRYPQSYLEQAGVSAFFQQLDNLISLQQEKIRKTKALKDAYLSDMFPKEGEKYPKLRFEGFKEPWIEYNLGKIGNLYQPQTISRTSLLASGVPVFGANGYIGYYSKANHEKDQITISARGENAGNPSYVNGPVWITGNSMVVNIDENTNVNKKYLYSYLSAQRLEKYITGGAQPQLTREVLNKVPIQVPSLSEQTKIGQFFKVLDKQITLHQRKLEKLENLKKAYLNEMFV